MAADGVVVEVVGTRQLQRLAARLEEAGSGKLKRSLTKRIRDEVKPLIDDVRESAESTLPSAGGLAAEIASSRFSIRTRLTGSIGVSLRASSSHQIKGMNAGRLRHPVFGRDVWVSQRVPGGWFDHPTDKRADDVRRGLSDALNDFARDLQRGL